MKINHITASILSLCISTALFAEESKQVTNDDAGFKRGEDVQGKWWWFKNAKKFESTDSWLYHLGLSYSFSDTGGNIDSTKHNAMLDLALRKQAFTSVTQYNLRKSDSENSLTDISMNIQSQKFHQAFRYAVNDWAALVVGGRWTKSDSTKYIDRRVSFFGGSLFSIIDQPGLILNAGVFYGNSNTSYMNKTITKVRKYQDFIPVEDYDSGEFFLSQTLRWKLSDNINFEEKANYIQLLEDTEYSYGNLTLGLEFKINKNISVVASYDIEYDYNPFINAAQEYLNQRRIAGLSSGDMDKIDTSLSLGFRIKF
jgi:hypothetical protein